ncbi:hypothetical protein [uncultured Stenotrophomonas sp.]|uniref:hypothetical protein n=1 Tax=uncultured Stenotrophomonas sp. TaxID=165438 RepID=UPI0028E1E1A5|nr:hypothetical protein [uncultured Stenotrophomonas sp.]
MFIEPLGVAMPFNPDRPQAQQESLMRHLQAALAASSTKPEESGQEIEPTPEEPTPETKPIPPDIAELTRQMAVQWWVTEFTQKMIFGDDEMMPKPDEF